MIKLISNSILISIFIIITSCGNPFGKAKKVDLRKIPVNAQERAKQNVEQGRGVSIKNLGRSGKTSYEFSTSNPMWRASLEVLDFLPLSNVDYSGGVIISDWYNESNKTTEQLKITVRFLSNEVRSDSLKIIVHQKKCTKESTCTVSTLNNSKIKTELASVIIKKAARLEQELNKK